MPIDANASMGMMIILHTAAAGHRGGTGTVKYRFCIKQVSQQFGIVVHPVAIQILAAAPEIVIAQLIPYIAVNVVEVTVSVCIKGLEFFVVSGILVPCVNVRAIGEQKHISVPNNGLYGVFPTVGIRFHPVGGYRLILAVLPFAAVGQMAVGVAGNNPAFVPEALSQSLGIGYFLGIGFAVVIFPWASIYSQVG